MGLSFQILSYIYVVIKFFIDNEGAIVQVIINLAVDCPFSKFHIYQEYAY